MLKILYQRLVLCIAEEMPDVQAGFKRVTRYHIAIISYLLECNKEFQKESIVRCIKYRHAFNYVTFEKLDCSKINVA